MEIEEAIGTRDGLLAPAARVGRKYLNPVETHVGGLGMAVKVLRQYWRNSEQRVPAQPLGPFRTDTSVYAQPPGSGLRVTWLGHSSLLLEQDGLRVLLDPMWDERASPFPFFGPKRFFRLPLPWKEMPRIDAVVISHDHYDHLGKHSVARLARHDAVREAQWITSKGVGKLLRDFGVRGKVRELNWTEGLDVQGEGGAGLRVTALPARHFSGRKVTNRYETLWSSFVLAGPKHRVYFGADSGEWDGFAQIGREYGPFDLTMLDTGAFNELWKQIHMGPDGAARTFTALGGAGLLMPIHWGLFDLALHGWRWPIERLTEVAEAQGIPLWSPVPGLPTEVVPGEALQTGWWRQYR